MRVVVVGTSGSGKTTLGRKLAAELDVPFIELDAINWQPGWRGLNEHDPPALVDRVRAAIAPDAWVSDGNYSDVRRMIWSRATHLIWLDYERPVIMSRVIRRSLWRTISARELWPGTANRELFIRWLDKGHPIRWAWDTFKRRRDQYEAMIDELEFAHLEVIRLRHPREANGAVAMLAAKARSQAAP